MTPRFALSLDHERIALLHRTAGAWHPVGEVATDATDLDAALQDLRARAMSLEPDGPRYKIIIPDDQIRHLSVDTGPVDPVTRDQLVRAALADATPYDIADLRYDISVAGSLTHVAAVATETLDEARGFARKHGFVPVSFVASSEGNAFAEEPFFGSAESAVDDPSESAAPIDASAETPPETGFATRRDKGIEPSVAGDDPDAAVAAPVPPAKAVTADGLDVPEDAAELRPDQDRPDRQARDATPAAPSPGFTAAPALSRPLPQRPPGPAVASIAADFPEDEATRMTAFGARQSPDVAATRRFPRAALGAGVLVMLAAAAIWAGFARNEVAPPETTLQSAPSETARRAERATGETLAAIPTTPNEKPADTDRRAAIGEDVPQTGQTDTAPHATPREPETPAIIGLNDLYIASIDRTDMARNPDSLPPAGDYRTDVRPGADAPPASATSAPPDQRAIVTDGILTADGVRVYQGRPPVVPPAVPTRFENAPKTDTEKAQLAAMRPRSRPETVTAPDDSNGATPGETRPPLRPESLAAEVDRLIAEQLADAEIEPDDETGLADDATATALAIELSRKPNARPGNFANIVKKVESTPKPQSTAAAVAPVTVAPKIPSSASVSRQATLNKALNLRKINLIGVYGPPSNRRALVRLSNGRYKKVKIGDTVDGGRVIAIGDNNLHYQKGGRSITLAMPQG